MKNSVLFGLIIGVLSIIWLFVMRGMGYYITDNQVAPIEYISGFIPLIGLFFGVKNFRDGELRGQMGFLEALIQSFKILLVGGALAVFSSIVFINWFNNDATGAHTFQSFSGRIFGALLIGVIQAFVVSLMLTTKAKRID